MVKAQTIRTKMGFVLDGSRSQVVWTANDGGQRAYRTTQDIKVGDRIAIPRGMEVWGNVDPLDGLNTHLNKWQEQFEGKRGPKPSRLAP